MELKYFANLMILLVVAAGLGMLWLAAPSHMTGSFSTWKPVQEIKRQLGTSPTVSPEISPGRLCTNDHLVQFYEQNNSLPSQGRWDKANNFYPNLCELNTTPMQRNAIHACLQQRRIKHVMTIGDSNAKKYSRAAISVIKRVFSTCTIVRSEKMLDHKKRPEPAYFALGDKAMEAALISEPRGCRTCISSTLKCRSKLGNFTMEHIGMGMIWDNSLAFRSDNQNFSGDSFQEIILKYYISKVKPDLILLFPPFNHLKSHNYTRAQQAMHKAHEAFKKYLPKTTALVWMPGFAEFENKKTRMYRNKLIFGLLATDIIQNMNRDMFKMLKKDLIDKAQNTFSFFDLVPISKSRTRWAIDGIHVNDAWYNKVFDYWLQTFCRKSEND